MVKYIKSILNKFKNKNICTIKIKQIKDNTNLFYYFVINAENHEEIASSKYYTSKKIAIKKAKKITKSKIIINENL